MMKHSFLVALAVCATVAIPEVAASAEIDLDIRFSGAVHFLPLDSNVDGVYSWAGSAETKGTLGRSMTETIFEFSGPYPVLSLDCDLETDLIQENHVSTFNDGSMLFFVATWGGQCINLDPFEMSGTFGGDITGGTGRFEGAGGSWEIYSPGIPVSDFMTAITGTLTGTLVLPD